MTVEHRPDEHRFVLMRDGVEAGELTYLDKEGYVVLDHTFIDPALRGQRMADTLVREALDQLRQSQTRFIATCPFVTAYLKRHRPSD